MKTSFRPSILAFVIACLGISAHAQLPAPAQAVSKTINQFMRILQENGQQRQVQDMCQLVRGAVDTAAISTDLLGYYLRYPNDQAGVRAFEQLMPSIIVSQFYSTLESAKGSAVTVSPRLLPRGSGKAGVDVSVGSTHLVITVNRSTLKILDAEWSGYSLVNTKRSDYQRDLNHYRDTYGSNARPISSLVQEIESASDLLRCN